MNWFRQFLHNLWHGNPHALVGNPDYGPDNGARGPLPGSNGDWVVMPYRMAEACRITLHTVSSHPELPPQVRWWISHWLAGYNMLLSSYFQEHYGPDIFPVLNDITLAVRKLGEDADTEEADETMQEYFSRWEEQLKQGGDHDGDSA